MFLLDLNIALPCLRPSFSTLYKYSFVHSFHRSSFSLKGVSGESGRSDIIIALTNLFHRLCLITILSVSRSLMLCNYTDTE